MMSSLKHKKNKVGIIVQARMTSSRLPNKIMLKLKGKTVLEHVIERCREVRLAEELIIVSPNSLESRPIEEVCNKYEIKYFTGSENDVLSRYYLAAKKYELDTIVRVTSDCPLIDPNIIDAMLLEYLTSQNFNNIYDYFSNGVTRSFPRGLDTEIFSFKSLEKAYNKAIELPDREHVTRFMYTNLNYFNIKQYVFPYDLSKYRVTLDTHEDFQMFQLLFKKAAECNIDKIYLNNLIFLLTNYPEIMETNNSIRQKEI